MFKNVTVAGGGMLGSQIAFQSAYSGKDVILYDINQVGLDKAAGLMKQWDQAYRQDFQASDAEMVKTAQRIHLTSDLDTAFEKADLVIEAVSEKPAVKNAFYQSFADYKQEQGEADDATVIVSNSSTLLPSQFAEVTGRANRFLNLHFAHQIWIHNIAEVMPHQGTAQSVTDSVIAFAKEIGMVPIILHKEQPAYVSNTLQISLTNAALHLWVNKVTDYKTIDKTWMIATGAPNGPFGLLDDMGLPIVATLAENSNAPEAKIIGKKIRQMVEDGKLGRSSGQGFYSYPNPEYENTSFLK